MADFPYARWYSDGSVSYTKGNTTVTGTKTFWDKAGIKTGDIFIDNDGKLYEVFEVVSSTEITLGRPYAGANGSGKGYSIIRTFNATTNSTLANQMSQLINGFQQRYNLDMKTIKGESAFDIAKSEGYTGTVTEWLASLTAYGVALRNGFTGSESEWLDSLKAAGEWSALQHKLDPFINSPKLAASKNTMYRGKDLGEVLTDDIKTRFSSTWDDIFVGDTIKLNGRRYTVAHFVQDSKQSEQAIIIWMNPGISSVWNETNTTEGGFYSSYLFNNTLPQIQTMIEEDWGSLASTFNFRVSSNNDQPVHALTSVDVKCMIPSAVNMRGYSSTAHPHEACYRHNYQFAIFRHNPTFIESSVMLRDFTTNKHYLLWNTFSLYATDESQGILTTNSKAVHAYFLIMKS